MSVRMGDKRDCARAFTLLELATVIVVVAILVVIAIPVIGNLRARAQRVACSNNLRSLAAGAELYIQDKGMWPQITITAEEPEQYAEAWIEALAPFGPTRQTWICPTIQNRLRNPDYSTPATARIDYFPTFFDDKPTSPHEWPTQPWFIEAGDSHGSGNLIIFTDGSIKDLKTVVSQSAQSPK